MVDASRFKIMKVLGEGGTSMTFLAYDDKLKKEVAFKLVSSYQLAAEPINNELPLYATGKKIIKPRPVISSNIDTIIPNRPAFKRNVDINTVMEVKALIAIAKDPCMINLACYYDAFTLKSNGPDRVCIISEYIEGQNLRSFMRNIGITNPDILWPIIYQMLNGLKFIHEKGFAHRDIKPENIMITPDRIIKYIDFGFACNFNCNGQRGTFPYFSPEMLSSKNEESLKGAQAQDIWGLGVTMFELANGSENFPFLSMYNEKEPLYDLFLPIYFAPSKKSNYTLDDGRTNRFIDSLLINDWTKRPTSSVAFNDFVKNVYKPNAKETPTELARQMQAMSREQIAQETPTERIHRLAKESIAPDDPAINKPAKVDFLDDPVQSITQNVQFVQDNANDQINLLMQLFNRYQNMYGF